MYYTTASGKIVYKEPQNDSKKFTPMPKNLVYGILIVIIVLHSSVSSGIHSKWKKGALRNNMQKVLTTYDVAWDSLGYYSAHSMPPGNGLVKDFEKSLQTSTPTKNLRFSVYPLTAITTTSEEWHTQLEQQCIRMRSLDWGKTYSEHKQWSPYEKTGSVE